MKPAIERRNFNMTEIRAITDEAGLRKVVGYASVFNVLTDMGWYYEKVAPGAFTESINQDDIRSLKNHNADYVIARKSKKHNTLALSEDSKGLFYEATPPDTQWMRDLMVSIDRGDIDQSSFGFQTLDDEWSMVDGKDCRTLKRCKLWDVSPVAYPQYPDATVGLRSLEQHRKAIPKENNNLGLNVLLEEEDATYKTMIGL